MKKDLISYFLVGMLLFSIGGIKIFTINTNEPTSVGEDGQVFVNIKNTGKATYDDMIVKIIDMDTGDYYAGPSYDIERKSVSSRQMDIPFEIPGEHLLKVIAENDDVHKAKYVYFDVYE